MPPSAAEPGLFFIRGSPRSGTNWVGALLNLHPHISCAGEFHLEHIFNAKHQIQALRWQLVAQEPVRSALDRAFQNMLRECIEAGCPGNPGTRWMGDRTPREMLDICPGGSFFWIVRDGRDVLVSWTRHLLRNGPELIRVVVPEHAGRDAMLSLAARLAADPCLFETDPPALLSVEPWVRFFAGAWARRWRSDSGCAAYFDSPGSTSRVLRLRYEALVADVESERANMYRFLDLDPSLAMPVSRQTRTTPACRELTWQAYFSDANRRAFMQQAGAALAEAGYAADGAPAPADAVRPEPHAPERTTTASSGALSTASHPARTCSPAHPSPAAAAASQPRGPLPGGR